MVYCGNATTLPARQGNASYYTRMGTRHECLKQGIGAGGAQERIKGVPADSLQRIKYITPAYDAKFAQQNIRSRHDLITTMQRTSPDHIFKILRRILVKGNSLDARAYNSVLLYLYEHGNESLPPCKKI